MVGRAALGKPYLLKQIATELAGGTFTPPSKSEQFTLISTLYQAHITHYGEKMGVRHVRKHLAASLEVAEIPAEQRQAILTANNAKQVEILLEEAFA
jgi:tRNA-dihydrouridine synthase B